MTVWTGQNWQLVDGDERQSVIGVTFGIGLLDEEVGATGTLSIALAALRTELSRPIDFGEGLTFVPEVSVELGTDTASIAVRGGVEGISAAWRRLPELFNPGTVTKQTAPLRPDASPWPADLLRRTGHNSAALAWLRTTSADAHDRAGVLLTRLNPTSGEIPTVYFTTEKFLVGLAFPIAKDDVDAGPRTRWADGTSVRSFSDLALQPATSINKGSSSLFDDSLGMSPTTNSRVLLSAMVPRSASGLMAADLLCRQLSTVANTSIGYTEGMRLALCGAGEASYVVVSSESVIKGPARHELLAEAGKSLGLIPDSWIVDALAEPHRILTPRIERDRRLMGLSAGEDISTARLRSAIRMAINSVHLNFVPASAGLDSAKKADDYVSDQGRKRVFKSRVGRITNEARVETWEPTAPPSWISSLIVGQRSIRIGGLQPGHGHRRKITEGVHTAPAVAVLEDQADTLVIVDDQLRTLTVQPELFRRHKELRRVLDSQLEGVPRLSFKSGVSPKKLQAHIRRSQRAKYGILAGVAALIAIIFTINVINDPADKAVTERVTYGWVVQLQNGTEITVSGIEITPPVGDALGTIVTVQIDFCAGRNSEVEGLPPEVQRSVSADNFLAFNKGHGNVRAIDSDKQLRETTLREGQCATGDLVFRAAQFDSPRIAYKNEVGDDVVWYPYGQAPVT
ncbi:hypothetical protein MB46_05565 [Arthrobacter alpinus]|uniref:hypothetical protein n=1 Tax=Arthrobacter alpinus TaxID=656366 RepID=UPI0005C8D39B|nr:hypothetical protein [Arthrobacter alpinus]ALV45052.1 hypothetical protein MB46_05565 [Arthrobacter alpinus]